MSNCADSNATFINFGCGQPPPAPLPTATPATGVAFAFKPGGHFQPGDASNVGDALDLINNAIATGEICSACDSNPGGGGTDLTCNCTTEIAQLQTQITTLQTTVSTMQQMFTQLESAVTALNSQHPHQYCDCSAIDAALLALDTRVDALEAGDPPPVDVTPPTITPSTIQQ